MAQLAAIISKLSGDSVASKRVGIGNPGSIILVDVTLSDEVNYTAELTEHPVERGLDVTDHILIKPKTISIEGIASESPITLKDAYSEKGLLDQATDAVSAVPGAVIQRFGAPGVLQGASAAVGGVISNKLFSNSQSPGQQTQEALTKLLEQKTAVNVQIGKKSYPNMVITNLSFPRDPSLGQAVRFRATFKEIRKVSAKRIVVKAAKADVQHSAGQSDSLGNQNTNPADAPTTQKASILYGLGKDAGII